MAPTNNQGGTALATRGRQELVAKDGKPIDHVITRVDELVSQIADMRERYHVISPVISTSAMAPGFGAVLTVVDADTAKHSRDFYPLKSSQIDKDDRGNVVSSEPLFGPSKLLINRIGAAAGVTWLPFPYSLRVDDRRIQNFAEFTSTMEYWAPDGKRIRQHGTKAIDLRDGSALALTMTPAQLRQARPFIVELAETKSQLRALRKLGISQNYTLKELQKPFVVIQFSFQPDMSDPAVKLEVTKHYLGISNMLYGHQPQPGHELEAGDERPALPPSSARELPPELGGPAAANKPAPAGPREASFDDDEPVTEKDERRRHRVEHVLEKNAAGDWTIVLGDGAQHATNDKAIAKAASEAGKADKAIVLTAADDNGVSRVVEIQTLDEPAPAAAALQDEAEDDGLRLVEKIESRKGESAGKKDPTKKKPWTLYTIVLSTGESFKTFSDSFAQVAQEAKDKRWKVRVTGETNERYPDQQDLTSITLIDPRQGTLPVGEGEKY